MATFSIKLFFVLLSLVTFFTFLHSQYVFQDVYLHIVNLVIIDAHQKAQNLSSWEHEQAFSSLALIRSKFASLNRVHYYLFNNIYDELLTTYVKQITFAVSETNKDSQFFPSELEQINDIRGVVANFCLLQAFSICLYRTQLPTEKHFSPLFQGTEKQLILLHQKVYCENTFMQKTPTDQHYNTMRTLLSLLPFTLLIDIAMYCISLRCYADNFLQASLFTALQSAETNEHIILTHFICYCIKRKIINYVHGYAGNILGSFSLNKKKKETDSYILFSTKKNKEMIQPISYTIPCGLWEYFCKRKCIIEDIVEKTLILPKYEPERYEKYGITFCISPFNEKQAPDYEYHHVPYYLTKIELEVVNEMKLLASENHILHCINDQKNDYLCQENKEREQVKNTVLLLEEATKQKQQPEEQKNNGRRAKSNLNSRKIAAMCGFICLIGLMKQMYNFFKAKNIWRP